MGSEIHVGLDRQRGWCARFQGDIRDELYGLLDTDVLPVPFGAETSADEVIRHLSCSYPEARISFEHEEAMEAPRTCFDTLLFSLRRHGVARQLHFWCWVSVTITVLSIQNGADSEECLSELERILSETGVISRPVTHDRLTATERQSLLEHLRTLLGLDPVATVR